MNDTIEQEIIDKGLTAPGARGMSANRDRPSTLVAVVVAAAVFLGILHLRTDIGEHVEPEQTASRSQELNGATPR